jgi:hypothetical protein
MQRAAFLGQSELQLGRLMPARLPMARGLLAADRANATESPMESREQIKLNPAFN